MAGIYEKYRVFREPNVEVEIGHPVDMMCTYLAGHEYSREGRGEVWKDAQEVEGFYFVLRPQKDHHARVALAAYAESVRLEDPKMSFDLTLALEDRAEDDDG